MPQTLTLDILETFSVDNGEPSQSSNSNPGSRTRLPAQTPSPNGDDESPGSENSNGGGRGKKELNWDAIGAGIGVAAILVSVGIAYWTNKRNAWMQNLVQNMRHGHGHGIAPTGGAATNEPKPPIQQTYVQELHSQSAPAPVYSASSLQYSSPYSYGHSNNNSPNPHELPTHASYGQQNHHSYELAGTRPSYT